MPRMMVSSFIKEVTFSSHKVLKKQNSRLSKVFINFKTNPLN